MGYEPVASRNNGYHTSLTACDVLEKPDRLVSALSTTDSATTLSADRSAVLEMVRLWHRRATCSGTVVLWILRFMSPAKEGR